MLSLFLLSAPALAAADPVVPAAPVMQHALQLGVTASADPRVRGTRFAEGHRWGLQASLQVYHQPGSQGVSAWPLLSDADTWVAPRIGLLWRASLAGDRLHLELGAALDPIAIVEGGVLGFRSDLPVLGATFGAAIGGYHAVEYTTALELDVTPRVSLWGGFLVSAAALWWDGESLFDESALDDADTLLLLQPSVGLSLKL